MRGKLTYHHEDFEIWLTRDEIERLDQNLEIDGEIKYFDSTSPTRHQLTIATISIVQARKLQGEFLTNRTKTRFYRAVPELIVLTTPITSSVSNHKILYCIDSKFSQILRRGSNYYSKHCIYRDTSNSKVMLYAEL